MDLIERYVEAVTAKLRRKRRGEVERELRASILDALEARGASPESEADVAAVLAELGEPSAVAAEYEPGSQYLIGPELYPLFRRVVGVTLATLVAASAVGLGVSLLLGGLADFRAGEFLMDTLEFVLRGALVAVVVIVAVFAWLQRSEVKPASRARPAGRWDPRTLPAAQGPERATRSDSIVGLVATAVALVILGGIGRMATEALPEIPAVIRPLLRHAVIDGVMLLQVAAVLSALAHAVALVQGRWRRYTRAVRVVADAIGAFVFVRVPVELVVHRGALYESGLSENFVRWLIVNGIVVGVIGMIVIVGLSTRSWRGRRRARASGTAAAPTVAAFAIFFAALPAAARAQAPAASDSGPVAFPAGELVRREYRSETFGETRAIQVYLPPGYDAAAARPYPALYLLHGVMEDETAWWAKGRIDEILDDLIARGVVEPMIAVMPLGYGFPDAATRAPEMLSPLTDQLAVAEAFAEGLLGEIVPLVDREYRTRADAGSRAIAGLSMGGSQALYVGLNHPETFDHVVSLSGALIMFGGRYGEWFPTVGSPGGRLPAVVDLSVGSDDFLLPVNRYFVAWLAERGASLDLHEGPGGHDWEVYRREIARVAPLLFPSGTPRVASRGASQSRMSAPSTPPAPVP